MSLESEAMSLLQGQFTQPTGPIAVLDPAAVLALRLRLPSPRRCRLLTPHRASGRTPLGRLGDA